MGDLEWEDPLKQEMATHSSILDGRVPWIEELGRLQSMDGKELDTTKHKQEKLVHEKG